MNWQEAKESTLRTWRAIYDLVGSADRVEILTELNAVNDLCALAKEEARTAHDLASCSYCPAYQQFGGCRNVSAFMSELAARGDWTGLRGEIASFIMQLEKMEAPGTLEIVVH